MNIYDTYLIVHSGWSGRSCLPELYTSQEEAEREAGRINKELERHNLKPDYQVLSLSRFIDARYSDGWADAENQHNSLDW